MGNWRVSYLIVLLGFGASCAFGATQSWELRDGKWQPIAEGSTTRPISVPELDQAEQLLSQPGGYEQARVIVLKWLKANKDSPVRDRGILLLAEAYFQDGDRIRAFYHCDELMDNFADSPFYYRALEMQYRIADGYLNGYKRRFLGMAVLGAEDEAIEMLYRIQQRSPGSPLAEKSLRRTADYYYATSQFDLAGDAYAAYVREYPKSPMAPRARLRAAFSSLAQFRGLRYDATPLIDARAQLMDIVMTYPDLARDENLQDVMNRIDKSFARKILVTADFYKRTHDPATAVYNYRFLIETYPNTPESEQAKLELEKMPAWALKLPPPPAGGEYGPATQPAAMQ